MGTLEPPFTPEAPAQLVQQVLADYGRLARDHLQRYLPPAGNGDYLGRLVADYPGRGGKSLRPALCLAAAGAFGAEPEEALPTAASIELMHNALLIHDDIEDDSDQRRGQPTLHALYGVPLALNAGDALGLLSLRPLKANLARLGPRVAGRLYEETELMAWETTEGQAMELGWRHDNRIDLSDDDYLTMVLKKTCWLTTIHPLRTGCLIAGGGDERMQGLFRLGFFFGAAFQIQDDLLNLEGGDGYGKERDGDLLEGKRTLMLLYLLRAATPAQRERLRRFLARPRARRSARDVAWVRERIEACGAMDHARATARALAGAALHEFDGVFGDRPDSRDKRFLQALITWVLQRSH